MAARIEANPPNKRLAYVLKQYKKHPAVVLDLVRAVARRIGATFWGERVVLAARKAEPRLLDDMAWAGLLVRDRSDFQGVNTFLSMHDGCHYTRSWDREREDFTREPPTESECDKIWSAAAEAVIVVIQEISEFQKPHEIDALIPWAARNLVDESRSDADPLVSAGSLVRYDNILDLITESDLLIEWFQKKKPDLTKMNADDVARAVTAFEEDRVPETDFEWDDGWKIVKLATSTQIGRVGEALKNCLASDSSYHKGYCGKMDRGAASYFALLNKRGEPELSIEWEKGEKDPTQVYGENNSEPEGLAEEHVNEWIESRGGSGLDPFAKLDRRTREMVDFLREQGHDRDDNQSLIWDAERWLENLSSHDARKWIETLGSHNVEEAERLDSDSVEPEEWEKQPSAVKRYLYDGNSDALSWLVTAGLIFNEMKELETKRAENAPRPSRQQAFGFRGEPKPKPVEPMPRHFDLDEFTDNDAIIFRDAYHWAGTESANTDGWTDRDHVVEAAEWWANHFSAEDAATFWFDVGNKTQADVPIEVAVELREYGINANDVADMHKYARRTVNIHSVEDIRDAVEEVKRAMTANKKRTSKRRTSRRR